MNFTHYSYKNNSTFYEGAAKLISKRAEEAIDRRDRFTIALSGGNTPKTLYELLSAPDYRTRINWKRVHVFWGDERYVPKDNPQSNYHMAFESLLSKVPLSENSIHPIPGPNESQSIEHAARLYEQTIRSFFHPGQTSTAIPVFDVVLLGMGDDGHTASLYPKSPALKERRKLVVAVHAPEYAPVKERVTITLPVLNSALNVLFLVSGESKRTVLQNVLSQMHRGQPSYPASMVKPAGNLFVLTDLHLESSEEEKDP